MLHLITCHGLIMPHLAELLFFYSSTAYVLWRNKKNYLSRGLLLSLCRLTFSIYRVVSVALFASHQLTFSFMLTSSIMKANSSYDDIADVGAIPEYEWQVFLQGNILANMMDEKQLSQHDGM